MYTEVEMSLRSFKKLALLLSFILLIMWGISFNEYLYSQPISVDGDHDTKSVKDNYQKEDTKLNLILELSQSMSSHSQEFKMRIPQENDLQNMDSKVAQDLISRIKVNCRDNICSEFVSKPDKPHFDYCIKKT